MHMYTMLQQYNSEMNELKKAIGDFSKYVDVVEEENMNKANDLFL